MTTTSEFTTEAAVQKQAEVLDTMTTLYTKTVGRVGEAQKKTLDMAVQQTSDVIGAFKKLAQVPPGTPLPAMIEMASASFGQFVDLQKGAIDLAVEQTQTLAGLAGERFESASKATDAVSTILHDTVERAALTRKNAIDFYSAQTKTVFDSFKKQTGVAGTPVEAAADSMQRGFDTMVETQSKMMNAATKGTAAKARV